MKTLPSCEDYITSIEVQQLIKANELNGGKVVKYNGNPVMYAGGFLRCFPLCTIFFEKDRGSLLDSLCTDADKRSNIIASELKKSGLPYFVEFDYISQGIATSNGVFPIVIMDWVEAYPLKEYISSHISESSKISNLANQFKLMVAELHKASFSHGDLQHGNIMVANDGKIFLVDYDSMYVPGLENVSDEIKGLAGYQHPSRIKQRNLSPKSDYFSELIIYTSLIALAKYPQLWRQLNIEDTETLLFTQEDLDAYNRSEIFSILKKDNEIKPLVEAIEKALREPNLDNLLPLEEAIIPDSKHVVEALQKKWQKKPTKIKEEAQVDLDNLSKKWKTPKRQSTKDEETDLTSITSKWKK